MASYNQMPQQVLQDRARAALARLEACDLCPRRCGADRSSGEVGFCRSGRKARVACYAPHFGEEAPIVGRGGSGTIFFSGCNLACVFCQNYEISQDDRGTEVDAQALAAMMLQLQDQGCHNINFVTPTHAVPQILEALLLARADGLALPLVYNSSGYDSVETLRLLDGIFEIYMPDAKYGSDEPALAYSCAPGYTKIMKAAIREMHRQVGDLVINEDGIARRGLLVRHLLLPGDAAGEAEVIRVLSEDISLGTYLNIMDQYRPEYHACSFPELCRPVSRQEYARALRMAAEAGLIRGLAML
ncbi:MAG TPA: radical SAM protein [Methanothrix sp.]|nr:radical SAM protein [Methanothrix sp.]